MALITCPYCLKPHDSNSPSCADDTNLVIPKAFIDQYDQAPPLWLATFGYPQVGKTTYRNALALVLEGMSRHWPGF